MKSLYLIALIFASPAVAQMTNWTIQTSGGPATEVAGATVVLEQAKEGSCTVLGPRIPVTPGTALALRFRYTAENVIRSIASWWTGASAATTELTVTVNWYDSAGRDVDEFLAKQGFPPAKRVWVLSKSSATPVEVADNIMAPALAVVPTSVAFAQVRFTLEMKRAEFAAPAKPAKVQVSQVTLAPGEVIPTGLEIPDSGPADAGALSTQPDGFKFGTNLVPNGALEDGVAAPTGWRIIGDNSQGAAVWKQGGAYSGKHCLQIFDRGPFIKSWENPTEIYVPGGAPGNSYGAREEVTARFVSEPVPAEPGAFYQASAMLWFLNKKTAPEAGVHPVRIQFLDAAGKVMPIRNIVDDGTPCSEPYQLAGWQMALTFPTPAPAGAKSVRVVVALSHATYNIATGPMAIALEERGFALVDNIALYRVPGQWPTAWEQPGTIKTIHTEAFRAALKDGMVPYVPSSPTHRPNSLRVESRTAHAGGVLTTAPKAGVAKDLSLHVENLLGDRRSLEIRYELVDGLEKTAYSGSVTATLEPFVDTQVVVTRPAHLPYGPYLLRYHVVEAGQESNAGATRFAVLRPSTATFEEKGRLDYPFGMWAPFPAGAGSATDAQVGELLQLAGVGKMILTGLYLADDYFRDGADPKQRAQALEQQLAQAHKAVAALRQYGMHAIGWISPGQAVVPPDKDPILADTIRQLVGGLKDEIQLWSYGSEHIVGGIDLDATTGVGEGGQRAMSWGRQGSPRQWWHEYLVAYAAAKQANPTGRFGPFTCTDTSGLVVRDFFRVSPDKQLDCFEENMYANAFASLAPAYAEFKKAGLPDLPFFVQEFGVAPAICPMDGPGHVPAEATAAAGQTTYWVEVLHTFPAFCYGGQVNMYRGDAEGDLMYRSRVRPQYVAFATMTDCLGAGTFTAKYEVPGGLVFVRERAVRKGIVGVLWSTGKEAVAELEVGTRSVEVSDLWGNRRTVKAKNGVVEIPLTPLPQYVLGAKTIKPAPSVSLALANTSLDPADPQVTVTIKNDRKAALPGTLTLLPESAIAVTTAQQTVESVPGGATRSFVFHVKPVDPDSDKPLALRARFVTPQRTYEAVDTPNFHFALRVKTPPVIDGDLAEWSTACPFVADREDQLWKYQNKASWSGPKEFSGRLWMRWDGDNLYLAARVQDVGFTPGKSLDMLWAGDSIEMLFDLTGSLQKDAPRAQIALGTTADGKARVQRYGYEPLKAGELTSAHIVVKRTGTETVYEAAIPWPELGMGFKPQPGATISTAFGFNEGDAGLRMLSWYHTVNPHDPATFGRIRLVEPSASGATNSPPRSLLENGDFDDPAQKPGPHLEGWQLQTQRSKTDQLCGKGYLTHEGAYVGRSLCLERTQPEGNVTANGWSVPAKPGEIYLVRAQAKPLGNTAFIWVAAQNAQRAGLALPWMRPLTPGEGVAGGSGLGLNGPELPDRGVSYAPMAAVFEAPPEVAWLNLSLSGWNYEYSTSQKVYFDNVELYRLRP